MARLGISIQQVLAALLILLTCALLAAAFTVSLLKLTTLQLVLLLIILLVSVSPLGKACFASQIKAEPPKRQAFFPWVGKVCLLQLSYYFLLFLITVPVISQEFAPTELTAGGNVLLLGLVSGLTFQGLHPWSMVFLLSIAVGVIGPVLSQEKLSAGFKALFRNPRPASWYAAIDIAAMMGSVILIIFFVVMSALQLTRWLSDWLGLQDMLHQGSVGALLMALCTALLFSSRYFRKQLKASTRGQRQLGSLIFKLTARTLLLLMAFVLSVTLLGGETYEQVSTPLHLQLSTQADGTVTWLLIYWALGVCATPLLAVCVARLSVGRSVRQVMCFSILLPLIFAMFFVNAAEVQAVKGGELQGLAKLITEGAAWLLAQPQVYWLSLGGFVYFVGLLALSRTLNNALVQMTANLAGKNLRRFRQLLLSVSSFIGWGLLVTLCTGSPGIQYLFTLMALSVVGMCWVTNVLGVIKVAFRPGKYLS